MSKRAVEALDSGRNVRQKLDKPHVQVRTSYFFYTVQLNEAGSLVQVKPELDPYEDRISYSPSKVKSELEDGELEYEMGMTTPRKARFRQASKPVPFTFSPSMGLLAHQLQQAYWKRTDEFIRMTKERVETLERPRVVWDRRARSSTQQTRRLQYRRAKDARKRKEMARRLKFEERMRFEMRMWLDKTYGGKRTNFVIKVGEDGTMYIRERQKHDRTRFWLQQCIAKSDLLSVEYATLGQEAIAS
ncbi:hypothetical protein PQX77_013223 [Marasmius sp. AFHP31]|nr:hypothetical protein PQX77_013223 [Marasmius sp. AFHP31]